MATTPLNSPIHGQQRLAQFWSKYPNCRSLRIQPVGWGDQGANGGLFDGFDIDDVQAALGTTRFNNLMSQVKQVFCCSHRSWPATHADATKRGAEVHCIFASDLEAFLKAGH